MGELTEIVEKYGSKILLLLFIIEFQITSFIWITEKITFELGFGNFLLLNIYVSIPYLINPTIKRREDKKSKYNKIIDFYSSICFWGISRVMDWFEFNLRLYYLLLGYLGLLISIIYLVLNLRYRRDSFISRLRFYLSFLFLLISILIIIFALLIPPTLLPLLPVETYVFYFVLYVLFFIGLLIFVFRPEIKKSTP